MTDVDERIKAYNKTEFTMKVPALHELGASLASKVGLPAPEFEGQLLDGGSFKLSDVRGKRHVVLMMGSITSPMTAISTPGLNAVAKDFAPKGVDFYLVYTAESHPGANYRPHTSLDQKTSHARDLKRLENVQVPIIVDDLEGTIHLAYGRWPTSLFLIHKDGRLIYRAAIADIRELRTILETVVDWDRLAVERPDRAQHTGYVEYVMEHDVDKEIHHRVYERAGQQAFEDFWKLYPGLRNRWP